MVSGTTRSRSDWLLALVVWACVCAPAVAYATEAEDLQRAQETYERGEHERAIQLLEEMVGGEVPRMRDPSLILDARLLLGASYVVVERERDARRQFVLFLHSVDAERYVLDRQLWPDAMQRVFVEEQDRRIAELRAAQRGDDAERAAREQARLDAAMRLVALAQENEIEVRHEPLIAWLPFGAGQFQNGNSELGTFFAIAESLTLTTGLALLFVWVALNDIRTDAGVGSDGGISGSLLVGLQAGNWAAIGAFGILALSGVIEAHVNFVPSHRERRSREVPTDVLEGLDIAIGPGSIGARLRF
jgi:hypothetical protein